ncbi:MAG TPA: hypothetical protein VFZ53_14930 [Polyangiaceae bacterium]
MKRAVLIAVVAGILRTGPCFAAEPVADTSTAEVERCVEAHGSARASMLEERWFEARERMLYCTDPACPIAIRSDCQAWLEEVTRVLPTLLVVVERDDDGRAAVELDIDGQRFELSNPPRPIELPPGTHLVRVGLPGFPTVERVVALGKGEKNHVVRVTFARERAAPAPAAPPEPRPTRPIPIATYALGGGALAALATSGVFLASALSAKDDALERCAPECEPEEADSVDARLLAADLFGAAGLVLGGLAIYTFVSRPTVMEAAVVPKLELTRSGSLLSLKGRF